MSHFADFARFMKMDQDEREQHVTDLLADLAEVWLDDTPDSILVNGMIASFRALLEAANAFADHMDGGGGAPNQYVGGLFVNIYKQTAKHYASLAGITDVKRQFVKKPPKDE